MAERGTQRLAGAQNDHRSHQAPVEDVQGAVLAMTGSHVSLGMLAKGRALRRRSCIWQGRQ
eukprot:6963430-Pyramimonas_sp.AAC.1